MGIKFIEYITNENGSFLKQSFYSLVGVTASVLPFTVALSNKIEFENSNIQPYGFSSNYNPYNKRVTTTGVIAAVGGIGFGSWFTSLFFSPRKVLKTSEKEQVSIFNSDTDFLSNRVTLNAEKLEKIQSSHEIYNWNIFREDNNTIGVFYIEIPLQLEQIEKIEKIEIQ